MLLKFLQKKPQLTPEQKQARIANAAHLLDNEFLWNIISEIEQKHFDTFYNSDIGDREAREYSHISLRCIKEFKETLTTILKSAKFNSK